MNFSVLAFFGAPGPMEMAIIGIIALLLFGKRLPEVARGMGKSIVEFKKGIAGVEDEVNRAVYSSETSSTSASRPVPAEERDEVTAPKFEPPESAPQATNEQQV
ncbi:MAG: twin-arginine translocase TatA/TatE family subunit [Planctomycetaceae bacterium]|nr:twin-arginine translocase TatA/TatE family subunit [Planctomycetaceae bacterium]